MKRSNVLGEVRVRHDLLTSADRYRRLRPLAVQQASRWRTADTGDHRRPDLLDLVGLIMTPVMLKLLLRRI